MPSPRHDPQLLAAFQDGERCLVWARRRSDGTLYRLTDGDAARLKAWAKEHLECFIPDCRDRRLTTVARHPLRRDGFSHHAGSGGHTAEGEAHQQAKAALQAWVHDTLGPQGVTAVAEQASADRTRVADVMVTWPDGRQVALEVQYAALSVEQWRQRHESYRQQGITAVWLLGHAGRHLRTARRYSYEAEGATDGLIALGDLHAAMTRAGVPLLWINPVWRTGAGIGTAAVTATPHRGRAGSYGDGHDDRHGNDRPLQVSPRPQPYPRQQRTTFLADPLSACTLTPDGLHSPTLQRLHDAAAMLASIDTARQAADAQQAAAAAAARAAREARERVRTDERTRWIQQQRERQQAAWDTSPLKQGLLLRHDTVPALLSVRLGSEGGIYAPPEHWRTALYRHLIWGKVSRSFTLADTYRILQAEQIAHHRNGGRSKGRSQGRSHTAADARAQAITAWLEHLQGRRYLALHRDFTARWRIDSISVLADDLDNPPPAPPAPARRCAASSAPRTLSPIPGPGGSARATGSPTPASEASVGESLAPPRLTPVRSTVSPPLRCRRCERPLDPILADRGLHVLC